MGFVGKDVLNEIEDEQNFYESIDTRLGKCRLSLASLKKLHQINRLWQQSIQFLQKLFLLQKCKT